MFLPDYIDLGRAEKYVLSIRIENDKFSFSMDDPKDEKCFCYRETKFSRNSDLLENLKRIIFDYNFLTNIFQKTNVLIVSDEYEILPNEFYNKALLTDVYNFSHYKPASHIENILISDNAKRITFSLEKDIYSFLIRSLINPEFFHHAGLLISYYQNYLIKHQYKGNNIFLNLQDNFTDIVSYNSKNQLINIQSYKKKDEMDIVYFLLNLWEKARLDQLEDKLHVHGNFNDSKAYNTLKEYIKNIYPLEFKTKKVETQDISIPLDLLILNNP